jgi:phosphoribosylanthranilate isomerase
MARVKICGLTSPEQARACVELGADAIGINFYAGSSRCVDLATGRAIAEAVGDDAVTVGVFVDADAAELQRVKEATGIRCLQLHGDEPPELLARFLPHAYKALRVRGTQTIAQAARYGGEHILLDAYVPGEAGGTGRTFEWGLATELARQRHVTLAGGLSPDNVAQAVAAVAPFCVDVASGVERAPGDKDLGAVERFIAAARA